MSETIFCQTIVTPCGELILQSVAGKLICCDWSDGWHRATIARRLERAFPHASCLEREDEVIAQTKRQLTEYFAGMRKTFDVPLRLVGTDFQHAVWQELLKLPYGTLTTYGEIACRIGRPGELRSSLRNFESQNEYGYKPCIKRRFQNAETLQSRNQKNSS